MGILTSWVYEVLIVKKPDDGIGRLATTILKMTDEVEDYQLFLDDMQEKIGISLNELNEFLYGAGAENANEETESYYNVTKKRVLKQARERAEKEAKFLEGVRKLNSRQRTLWLLEYLEYYGTQVKNKERLNYSLTERQLGITRQTLYIVSKEINQVLKQAELIYGIKKARKIVATILINNKKGVWKRGVVQLYKK